MLNLEPIMDRLKQATTGPWSWQQDMVRKDYVVMNGSQLVAVCRYQRDAHAIAGYREDTYDLVKEVERLRKALGGLLEAVTEDGSKDTIMLATAEAERALSKGCKDA